MFEEEAPCTEECEKCAEEAKADVSSKNLYWLRRFSDFLVSALKTIPNQKDILFKKFLKCDPKDQESLDFSVACYQQREGCYATNKFLHKKADIRLVTDFTGDCCDYASPDYSNVEIKRNKRIPLLVEGYMFIYYKKVGMVVHFYFTGLHPNATFTFNKKDRSMAIELVEAIRTYMQEYNFLKGEKLKLTDGYWFSFLNYPKIGWDKLILPSALRDEILLNLIFPLNNEKLCKKHKIPWRRGLLLGGEPGTGKTKLAKVLCNLLDKVTVIWVTAESLREANHVKALFRAARYFKPTLLIMEDIDFFGADREIERSPIMGELLNQLDGNAPNDGVFVMASSNRPGLLDKALANRPGRFDVKLEVKLPDIGDRLKMLNLFAIGKQLGDDVDFTVLSSRTNGLTGAHIQEALVYATLDSLHKGVEKVQMSSIEKAIKRMKDKKPSRMTV